MSIYLARITDPDGVPIAGGKRDLEVEPSKNDWASFGLEAMPDGYAGQVIIIYLVDGTVSDTSVQDWPT